MKLNFFFRYLEKKIFNLNWIYLHKIFVPMYSIPYTRCLTNLFKYRCKYFSFLSACKVGCKVLGHTTGVCDENDKCFCSEEDYNFFHDVSLWLGKLDISEVVKRQINKFQRKIGNLFIQKMSSEKT